MKDNIILNEDKEIKLRVNTEKVVIEIPVTLLIDVFNDGYEGNCMITNKKTFRENFAIYIREELENEVMNNCCEYIFDNEDGIRLNKEEY